MPQPTLSLVVPVYNEARRIEESLRKLASFGSNYPWVHEVIFFVEPSSDRTAEIIQAACKNSEKFRLLLGDQHRGKGFAVRQGILSAQADWVLFCDADLAVSLDQIPAVFQNALNHPGSITIGHRFMNPGSAHTGWLRKGLSAMFRRVIPKLLGLDQTDTQAGFKLFPTSLARAIFKNSTLDGFAFDLEALLIAQNQKIPIREGAVVWFNRPNSSFHPLKIAFPIFRDIVRLFWRFRIRLLWKNRSDQKQEKT